jgi:hypothetical protein
MVSAMSRRITVFAILTLVLTWGVWVPRALASHDVLRGPVADGITAFADLWSWAPAIAALITAALCDGRTGVRT